MATEKTWTFHDAYFLSGGSASGTISVDLSNPNVAASHFAVTITHGGTTYFISEASPSVYNVGSPWNPGIWLKGVGSFGTPYTLLQFYYSNNVSGSRVYLITPSYVGLTGQNLNFDFGYNPYLSSNSYTDTGIAAGGSSARSMGQALDQALAGAHSADLDTVNTILSTLSVPAQQIAVKQLGAGQLVPQLQSTNVSLSQTGTVIESHAQARLEGTGISTGDDSLSSSVLGEFLGGVARRKATSTADGYSGNFYGVVFGVDRHVTDEVLAGVALSWVHSNFGGLGDVSGVSSSVDTYMLSAYGSWRNGPTFVNGQIGFGGNLYEQSRALDFVGRTATAKYHGLLGMAKLDGGYDIDTGPFVVTPIAGIQASRTENRSYTESGAGALNLSVDRQGFNSIQTDVGAKVSMTFDTNIGKVTPEVSASWLRDLTRGRLLTTGSLAGAGFSSESGRSLPNGLGLKTGMTIEQSNELSFHVEYNGDLRGDYQSHTGLLKATYKL